MTNINSVAGCDYGVFISTAVVFPLCFSGEKDEFAVPFRVQRRLNKLAFQRKATFPVETNTNIKQIQRSAFAAPVK